MEQCQILREYAIYVARVRKYAKYMQLETAVKKAVDECIQEEILEEFLRKNRAEVIAVSIFEYDEEGVMDVLREEAREEARKQALTEGRDEATLNAIKNIMDSLHVSVDKAMDILKIDTEKREQLKKLLSLIHI